MGYIVTNLHEVQKNKASLLRRIQNTCLHRLPATPKYSASSPTPFVFLCQCRQCQIITGTGHSAKFVVSDKDTIISGELKFYELTADSGNTVTSGFCLTCGNPVLKKSSGYPGMLFFHAATVDNPAVFKPQTVFWAGSHQPWDYVNPDLELKQNT